MGTGGGSAFGAGGGKNKSHSDNPVLAVVTDDGARKLPIVSSISSVIGGAVGRTVTEPEKVNTFVLLSRLEGGASVGDCPSHKGPVNVSETQTFQAVDGQQDLFVFSAFLDELQNVVRLISLAEQKGGMRLFCHLWYHQPTGGDASRGAPQMRVAEGSYSALPEHHGRRYTAAYITCRLPDDVKYRRPYAVSVTNSDCRQASVSDNKTELPPSNVLLVKAPPDDPPQRNFTICVTALNYKYSKAYELVEMIELNRILGAELFTFYVYSVGDNVKTILDWYQQQGIVQLVDWKLPMRVDHWPPDLNAPSEVHYFGQLASHNDCLNRHRGFSRYLVYEDLDEFIIPKKHHNWSELIQQLEKDVPGAVYSFSCQFFRKEWGKNMEEYPGREIADKYQSVVLSTVHRESSPYPRNQRTKYIIRPEKIDAVGIHNIWQFRGLISHHQVAHDVGLLHHYRTWERPEESYKAVNDTSMYKYRDDLLGRLKEVWSHFPDLPLDIAISTYGQV